MFSVSPVTMMNTAPSSQKHQPAFSQNINSFLSNFNYNATSPLNLVQSSDVEESPNQGIPSSREGVANSDHARPIKVEPPNNFELGETELKNRSEYQAGLASRLGTFPGWTMKGKGLDSPRGVHFVSKSKALEHVMANGGLQEEVKHFPHLIILITIWDKFWDTYIFVSYTGIAVT